MLARERCLKYWCKIIRSRTNTIHSTSQEQCDSLLNKGNNWGFKVKQVIKRLGLGHLWNNRDNATNFFPNLFKSGEGTLIRLPNWHIIQCLN